MDAAEHEHPGRHHRGRVQVGRHRRGRRHRARQPEVQRHLRALGQRGDGDQRAGDRRGRVGAGALEELRQRERPVGVVEQHGAEQERHRADARDQQRHQRRAARLAPVAVEPDQEVRRDRGQVEEDEQQDQVARARQPDHRHHEQRHPRPEAPALGRRPALVLEVERQVGRAVGEDDRADARRQQRVERAEPVEREVEPQVERRRPRHVDAPAARQPPGEAGREPGERAGDRGPGKRAAAWRLHRRATIGGAHDDGRSISSRAPLPRRSQSVGLPMGADGKGPDVSARTGPLRVRRLRAVAPRRPRRRRGWPARCARRWSSCTSWTTTSSPRCRRSGARRSTRSCATRSTRSRSRSRRTTRARTSTAWSRRSRTRMSPAAS